MGATRNRTLLSMKGKIDKKPFTVPLSVTPENCRHSELNGGKEVDEKTLFYR